MSTNRIVDFHKADSDARMELNELLLIVSGFELIGQKDTAEMLRGCVEAA